MAPDRTPRDADSNGPCLLVSPHRFPSMAFESQVAERAQLPLVVADDDLTFRRRLGGARAVLVTPQPLLDAAAIGELRSCVAIVRYGVGVDNVDIEAATANGIPVANVTDASVEEVASHSVAMALALVRRLGDADESIRSGAWSGAMMGGARRVSSLTVGIVGAGRIGQAAARMFAALGANVIVHDPVVQEHDWTAVSFDELIRDADVVSLHLPLTDETRGVVSADTIRSMRRGAIVVNVSRGGLIDEEAVAGALHDGQLGGAGLDVFETEPPAADHPLRTAPRAILTPHVAWRSEESVADLQRKACEQVAFALRGEPMPAALNPAVYSGAQHQP